MTMLDIEDAAQLLAYLRATERIAADEQPLIRVLAGGVSNRTVLVQRASGEAWVLKQALAKLRVAADWFSSPARIRREALGMRYLKQLVPEQSVGLVFEDKEQDLLAMEAVPDPQCTWKTLLLAGQLEEKAVLAFAQILATIHRDAWLRRNELSALFAERSFFETLRIEPYYGYSAQQVPAAQGFYQQLIADTRARLLTLVHGDYSPKNILVRGEAQPDGTVVYGDKLVLLDHEVIHWGDPAFDLGFALTHLLSKAHHLRSERGRFVGAALAFWQYYAQQLGDLPWAAELESFALRHTLGCLLARVAGRSPLEYLDAAARARQQEAVLALMTSPPPTIRALGERWLTI